MQIVIDIPEEVKEAFDNASKDDIDCSFYDYNSVIGKAIRNGTALPKGHGRLVDVSDLLISLMKYIDGDKSLGQCIDDTPTVIEAEGEE